MTEKGLEFAVDASHQQPDEQDDRLQLVQTEELQAYVDSQVVAPGFVLLVEGRMPVVVLVVLVKSELHMTGASYLKLRVQQ